MEKNPATRIAYLCSEFPALSHTFISREVSVLEGEGLEILPVSINPARHVEEMDPSDRAYAARTYCVKATPKARILAVLLGAALRPRRLFRAASGALRLAAFGGPHDAGKAAGYFVEALLLDDWARRAGVRHVHVHFANAAATVALIASRLGWIEYSLSVHGPDEFYDVERNVLRQKIAGAVFIRCIGHYCRSQLMRLSPLDQWGKFRIVRCGVFRGEFRPREEPPRPARTVLCVGRLCPSKGQAVLVEAADILRRSGRDLRFLLLGGGEDLEALRSLVEERGLSGSVTLAGPVGHSRVREELSRCDLFVLPSFAEGIPVALMEAMASGVPVVSTAIMGIPELIESGTEGLLVRPSDAEQLAGAIASFADGRADAAAMVARAAEKVETMFDAEANARELASLFLSLEAHR